MIPALTSMMALLAWPLLAPAAAGDWKIEETEHYRIEIQRYIRCEAPPDYTAIALAMEAIHREYLRLTGPLPPGRTPDGRPAPKFAIKIFGTADVYDRHLRETYGLDSSSTYGYFTGDTLYSYSAQGTERLLGTLFHEGWHQVLRAHVQEPPPWFNEGVAEYFETFRFNGTAVEAQAPSWENLLTLQNAADAGAKAPSLREFIALDRKAYHGLGSGYANALAWSLAAFLLHVQDPVRRQVIPRTVQDLLAQQDARHATETGFEGLPLDPLDTAWRASYQEKRVRKVVRIIKVHPDTQAARKGLAPGDIIARLDGRSFGDPKALVEALHEASNRTRTMDVERDGQLRTVRLKPGFVGITFQEVFAEAPASPLRKGPPLRAKGVQQHLSGLDRGDQ